MDNQHRLIKGYRELNAEEIALMNRVKDAGPILEALTEDIRSYLNGRNEVALAFNTEEAERIRKARPHHWLDQGTLYLQMSLMLITRSIAQPMTF